MKLQIALLKENDDPIVLYEGAAFKEFPEAEFIQLLTGPIEILGDHPISLNIALTLGNLGCSLFIEQSDETILNLTFGVNYPPTVSLVLKSGQKIYASLDFAEEIEIGNL